MHVKMLHFILAEIFKHVFEPRPIIFDRFKASLLSCIDVPEIDGRNKTFIDFAELRNLFYSADLRDFSHSFRAKQHIFQTVFINSVA